MVGCSTAGFERYLLPEELEMKALRHGMLAIGFKSRLPLQFQNCPARTHELEPVKKPH